MSETERLKKLLDADPSTLEKVDAVLAGVDCLIRQSEEDCRLITITETAKMLNVSRPTVYGLIKAGKLHAVTLDSVQRVRHSSVVKFVHGINN